MEPTLARVHNLRYHNLTEISSNNFIRVFRAHDIFLDTTVALKLLKSIEKEEFNRFAKEFGLIKSFIHPNITKAHDFGFSEEGFPFFTLEFVDGGDIKSFSQDKNFSEILPLLVQVCQTLDFLHIRGILHGDIKPSNILVACEKNGNSTVKLTDFGFAEVGEQFKLPAWKGTFAYLAPEIIAEEPYDFHCDLYSLGILLFELFTGRLPFEQQDSLLLAKAHLEQIPTFSAEEKKKIPGELRAITLSLLAKDPLERPRSAHQVAEVFINLLSDSQAKYTQGLLKNLILSADVESGQRELSLLKKLFQETDKNSRPVIIIRVEDEIRKDKLLREFSGWVQVQNGLVCRLTENKQESWQKLKHLLGQQDFDRTLLIVEGISASNLERLKEVAEIRSSLNSGLILLVLERRFFQELNIKKSLEDEIKSVFASTVIELDWQEVSQEEVASSIQKNFGHFDGIEEFSTLLYRKTGGNFDLIKVVLLTLLEQQAIERTQTGWQIAPDYQDYLTLPVEYKRELEKLCQALDKELSDLLQSICIFIKQVEVRFLKRYTELEKETLISSLDELKKYGLIQIQNKSEGSLVLVKNEFAGNFVLTFLNEEKRKELHGKAATVISEFYPEESAEKAELLAYHFENSGNLAAAARYILLCAKTYQEQEQLSKSGKFYEKLLQIQKEPAQLASISSLISSGEIYEALGEINASSGKLEKSKSYYEKALEFYSNNSGYPEERRSNILWRLGVVYSRSGLFELAERYLKEVLEHTDRQVSSQKYAAVLSDLGWLSYLMRDFSRAVNIFQQGEVILASSELDKLSLSAETGGIYNRLGICYWSLGEYEKSYQYYSKSLQFFEKIGEEKRHIDVINNLALLCLEKGEKQNALSLFEQALSYDLKKQDIYQQSISYSNISLVLKELYRLDEAYQKAQKALELSSKSGHRAGLGNAFNNLGLIFKEKGSLLQALYYFRKALKEYELLSDKHREALVYYNLGELFYLQEEWDKAGNYFQKSLQLRESLKERAEITDSLFGKGRVLSALGEFPKAFEIMEECYETYRKLGKTSEALSVLLSLGETALKMGNTAAATDYIKLARSFEQAGQPPIQSRVQYLQGQLLIKQGFKEEALKEWKEAIKNLSEISDKVKKATVSFEIGKLLIDLQKPKLAIRYLEEAKKHFQNLNFHRKVKKLEVYMQQVLQIDTQEKEKISTFYQISELLNCIMDLETLLDKCLDLAIQVLGAERGLIVFYSPSSGELLVKAVRGVESETIKDALTISKKVIKDVIAAQEPFIVENARENQETREHQSVITHNILSILCVPLKSKDRILGTIYLDNRTLAGVFRPEDVEFLKAFSNLVAVAIEKAQGYSELQEDLFDLKTRLQVRYEYPHIIGKSEKMQEIFHLVEKVANTRASVLLVGENGTGKELIANLIHEKSERKNSPFIKVNCAALPESLLETELFGIEEHIATNVAGRTGKFEQADGGTIFLDEIGDMSLPTQAKVLRVLQEREFERVGGKKTIKVDIRLLSATNMNLEEQIKKGLFRRDLYFRLNPITLFISPLRERKEDIIYLVEHFLKKFCQEYKKGKITLNEQTLSAFNLYDWPGNVRELINIVERGVIFSEEGEFATEYLPSEIKILIQSKPLTKGETLREILESVEKKAILRALEQASGVQARAAKILGIPETTMKRKMDKYKIKKTKR